MISKILLKTTLVHFYMHILMKYKVKKKKKERPRDMMSQNIKGDGFNYNI